MARSAPRDEAGVTPQGPPASSRKRDPNRRQSILDAAAVLVAQSGYTAVGMADIGAEVGIAASAIYWHFPSKQDLLVSLFDQCLDRLLADQRSALDKHGTSPEALREVIRLHVDFAVDEREFARVYYREAINLPPADLDRLRRKQRSYILETRRLLIGVRPELDDSAAEALVHAAIGAIQSSLISTSRLSRNRLKDLLLAVADGVLQVSPAA